MARQNGGEKKKKLGLCFVNVLPLFKQEKIQFGNSFFFYQQHRLIEPGKGMLFIPIFWRGKEEYATRTSIIECENTGRMHI